MSRVLWLVIWSVNTPFRVILVPYYTLHLVTISSWSLNFQVTGSHLGKSRPLMFSGCPVLSLVKGVYATLGFLGLIA